MHGERISEGEFFKGRPEASAIHAAVKRVIERLGACKARVSTSQVGFYRERLFASTWIPGRYLKGAKAPLVLSVYLGRRDPSPRWKEVSEPAPGRFTHHLELNSVEDVDRHVEQVLEEAWCESAAT